MSFFHLFSGREFSDPSLSMSLATILPIGLVIFEEVLLTYLLLYYAGSGFKSIFMLEGITAIPDGRGV